MNLVNQKNIFIPFHLGDPAGILFFGHIFSLAHEVYEHFIIEKMDIPWNDWFNHAEYVIPLKHVEANFHLPIKVGAFYQVELLVKKIGTTSFTLLYHFFDADKLLCEVESVHIFCDKKNFQKIPLPLFFLQKLKQ